MSNIKAQASHTNKDSVNLRLKTMVAVTGIVYGGSLCYFYFVWYKNESISSFHWLNDNTSWLQMDKIGHATTVYTFSEYSYHALRWSGLNNNKAALYGSLVGLGSMTTVEIIDGFYSKWGASWGDLLANTFGAVLFATQQILWKEQRLRLKFLYTPTDKYARYNPDILGNSFPQRLISDYNSQTYWLSLNISSLFPVNDKFPKWLNLAFGYGGRGLATSIHYDRDGNVLPGIVRTREFYFSLDVDWQKIPTHSKFLKTLFKVISFVKLPFLTLEYNNVEKFVFHPVYL